MKKSLLILAMTLASGSVFAVGSSSITGASFGGYATGNEANTSGGFCSGTGTGCDAFSPTITTSGLFPATASTAFGPAGTAVTPNDIAVTDLGATALLPNIAASTGAVLGADTALESASGAGVTASTGALGDIDPTLSPGTGATPVYAQGTYTGMQALSVGAYNATIPNDPTVAGNTTGSVNALQKPDLGYATTNNTTSSTASAYKGQAVTYSGIAGVAQAVNANY
jgi:hypothetical protein